ncbi:MAG: hypothetical protein M1826_002860 [Phylliscum demangeonii]|nr:MAG: hypothetical protein M1826_002860 [Phylliscum demangeonii]
MTEVSNTRLYLGNLPRNATKADVEEHFNAHGTGKITEIKLMQGFGFIEYEDAMDARDVVPAFHGSEFMGERLTVQFARGSRPRDAFPGTGERIIPRPRRTAYRMQITGLPTETSWQDLKDFARQSGLDVVYSETGRERDGRGCVEYETAADLRSAVEKLDGREFKGSRVTCVADIQEERPRDRFRSRSPPGRRSAYPAPSHPLEDYDRRGPPPAHHRPGYSPARHGAYRERSPPPRREYYDSRDRYRSPPRDYGPPPPPHRYPHDAYDTRAGPPPPPAGPPRRAYDEPYTNGHARPGPYDRPALSPRGRPRSPPRGGYYEERRYW